MDAVFKKLNYKGQKLVHIINAPDSFRVHSDSISGEAAIKTKVGEKDQLEFVMLFATRQADLDIHAAHISPKLAGDAILWVCYPKGTSKKYTCDFNRDTGWQLLGRYDLEPVRQVAIDEDWSALRFRKVEFIKTLNRNPKMMLSEAARARTKK